MSNMNNMVVSKTVAQWLRDMGHNEFCDCYLHTDNDREDDYEMWTSNQHCNGDLPDSAERIAAPYVSDALLWLMQFKGIAINVSPETYILSESGFIYSVTLLGSKEPVIAISFDYQDALYQALDKLYEKYQGLEAFYYLPPTN